MSKATNTVVAETTIGKVEATDFDATQKLSSYNVAKELVVTIGGTIPIGNYANLKIEVSATVDAALVENAPSTEALIAYTATTLEKGIGYALADMLQYAPNDSDWQDAQEKVEQLLRTRAGQVVKENPFVLRCLRLVVDDYTEAPKQALDDIQF